MEINDKKLKQILKEQSNDFKRHTSTLAEDFHSQVKLIGEQYGSIKDTLDSHTKILDSHTKTLESHTAAITSIKDTLDYHTEMLGSVKEDVEIIKTDMEFIKNSLKRKVDIEEFAVLEKRVAALESKVRAR
jgi:chromosome segregation ATPase